MTDDVDLAMQLSESRIQLKKTEERLYSLLYETFAYAGAAAKLIEGILNKQEEQVAENIIKLAEWSIDMEINLLLNLLYPTTPTKLISPDIEVTNHNHKDLMERALEGLQEIGSKHAALITRHWDKQANLLRLGTKEQRLDSLKRELGEKAHLRLEEVRSKC